MKIAKIAIQVILVIAICGMSFLVYKSIQRPIKFDKAKNAREAEIVQKLKDIRTAEVAYKAEYKHYTNSFPDLIKFLKVGNIKVVKQIGDEDDSADIKAGRILRDTTLVNVLDSLFPKGYKVDELAVVPFSNGAKFKLDTATLSAGKVNVNVFEASVENDVFLKDLDNQLLVNYNQQRESTVKFPGLKVGSIEEPNNNAGNWE